LTLNFDEPLSTFAFKFNLRRYILGEKADVLVTCMDGADECAHCTDVRQGLTPVHF
jgi:hypothetical protein